MICDLNGKGLKWDEVKNGMEVKIKAKNVHQAYPTFEFLYSSEGSRGKHFIYRTSKNCKTLSYNYTVNSFIET